MKKFIQNSRIFLLVTILASLSSNSVLAQLSTWVYYKTDGKLMYVPNAKGNTVPDFSGVGYMNSEADIPVDLPIVKTVYPVDGDNTLNVQSAINAVSAMPIGSNGFRGVILFKSGVYPINKSINLNASGIVLRGEGADAAGTRFIATGTVQYDLFNIKGLSGITTNEATVKSITDTYVPVGAKKVNVASGHTFQVGDWVYFRRSPTQAWIDLLGTAQYGWTYSGYKMNYERRVVAVEGNLITLDAPIMDVVDPVYAQGYLVEFSSARIQNCGIENMRISSTYTSTEDELHGWNAVFFGKIINGWARDLEVYYFGYAAVNVGDQATWVTVDNCKCLDPMSVTTGGRKYSFNVDGQRNLIKNCVTRGGRHDYVTGSQTAGPNVFVNSSSSQVHADIGPHHRWSTGLLFDNIVSNGQINVQNRGESGSGHGWAGAQIMFWNCTGSQIICQDPPGDHINWTMGAKATVTSKGNVGSNTTQPLGIVQSTGTFVTPQNLFEAQLIERLAPSAPSSPSNVTAEILSTTQVKITWVDESYNEENFRVERSDNNGVDWVLVGSVGAGLKSYINTGVADNATYLYRVYAENATGKSGYSNLATASSHLDAIPSPWLSKDLGTLSPVGNSGYFNGQFTLNGSGADIWGASDECQFMYQPMDGDGSISAQVWSVAPTNAWAKSGVMIRESLNANAPNAFMLISATSGAAFQQRLTAGASTTSVKFAGGAPFWVKLTRKGNLFTAYQSSDGYIWTLAGSVTINMSTNAYVGLAVSSHTTGVLCQSTFNNVVVNSSTSTSNSVLKDKDVAPLRASVFGGKLKIDYIVRQKNLVEIDLIDSHGRNVKKLVRNNQQPGTFSQIFTTGTLSKGLYLVKMTVGNKSNAVKIMI
ncbi:MAG TPA: hypothetical protein VFP20_02555 [Bacteroidales bacterium]|nr:hypothetical protein [Bacteroidales bacterium]